MKIAILSSIAWRTPPRKYGPWEQVASNHAEGLLAKGIDITLFATGDSLTQGKLSSVIERPYAEQTNSDVKVDECLHISTLMERAGEFDIIHNHFDFLPLTYSRLINTPMVTTIHGFSSSRILPVYKKYNDSGHYVSISNANRHPDLNYSANIYNGIDTTGFNFYPGPGAYLLFFGRIHPEKGTAEAIELARRCGKTLIIAGLVQDMDYFEKSVKPFINQEQVIYAGNVGPDERNALLGNAAALLHLIGFEEPFGLSVVESMCCGTPVIAFRRGAMPELIEEGKTGFLVDNLEEATEVVNAISGIDRMACRKRVLANFSRERMAEDYLTLYNKVLRK